MLSLTTSNVITFFFSSILSVELLLVSFFFLFVFSVGYRQDHFSFALHFFIIYLRLYTYLLKLEYKQNFILLKLFVCVFISIFFYLGYTFAKKQQNPPTTIYYYNSLFMCCCCLVLLYFHHFLFFIF